MTAVLESTPVNLILASNSPRRHQLLSLTNWVFTVLTADVDEREHENESPSDYVLRLAETKARAVKANTNQMVLAADTTVVEGSDILGKPRDNAEAIAMLTRLRGRTHQVFTGIALLRVSDGRLLTDLCVTDVPMRNYSNEEIHAYIATGDPLDKAGAYAIQHPGFHPVARMDGCYASVMGLPLCHVTRLMRHMNIDLQTDVPLNCQKLLEYDCPVFDKYLKSESLPREVAWQLGRFQKMKGDG